MIYRTAATPMLTDAGFYRCARASGAAPTPKPLYDAKGVAYLQATFDEIDAHWGSMDAYLTQALGLDAGKIARLRAIYLE